MEMDDLKIEATARACHEANRAYCIAIGDTSHPSFCGRSLFVGVMFVIILESPQKVATAGAPQAQYPEVLARSW